MDYRQILQESHDYGCIMLRLPDEVKKAVIGYGYKIPDDHLYNIEEYGRETKPHITIKYGFSSDIDPEFIRRIIYPLKSIEFTLGNINIFDCDEFDVLKIEVKSPDLERVNKDISNEYNIIDKHIDYNPHITIAFLKKGMAKYYIDSRFAFYVATSNEIIISDKDDNEITLLL